MKTAKHQSGLTNGVVEHTLSASPLTPALSPLRGEGVASPSPLNGERAGVRGENTQRDPPLDLAEIRARLNGVRGQSYWRSLEELAETKEFQQMLQREFPAGASEWLDDMSRRSFLKLAAASLALSGLSACTKQPTRQIVPYVKQPAELVLGE